MDDRRDGVEEGERILARQIADGFGQRRRGQRPGGDDDAVPVFRRQAGDLARTMLTSGWAASVAVTAAEKPSRSTARAPIQPAPDALSASAMMSEPSAASPDAAGPRHCCRVIGAETVGTDQFGQPVGLVRVGAMRSAHLMQDHGDAGLGDLPGGFGTGEAAANDVGDSGAR
jgi:hypothetical protein